MRLLRVGKPASRVADDVRASLTALGRGDADIGGIALVDATPTGTAEQFDAVLILPHGIVIVAGVDLPGPAMRLEAPLRGQWKADNWPLVGASDGPGGAQAVNPASGALAAADALASRLNTLTNMAVPVGLVLAVGPFVDTVVTVPLRGEAVRVVYPTPTKLREAIVSLAPDDGRPCSVEQARAVLRLIDPELPIQSDDVLAREGFSTGAPPQATHAPSAQYVPAAQVAQAAPARGSAQAEAMQPALAAHVPTTPIQPPAPSSQRASGGQAQQTAVRPTHQPEPQSQAAVAKAAALAAAAQAAPQAQATQQGRLAPQRQFDADDRPTDLMPLVLPPQAPQQESSPRKPEIKLVPLAAVLLVVAGLVAAIVMATSGSSSDDPPPKAPQQDRPERYAISGVAFSTVATSTAQACDQLTYGDVQVAVQKTPCAGMQLGSYLATVSGRQAAVSVAVVEFAEPAQAEKLKKLADKAGFGWRRRRREHRREVARRQAVVPQRGLPQRRRRHLTAADPHRVDRPAVQHRRQGPRRHRQGVVSRKPRRLRSTRSAAAADA